MDNDADLLIEDRGGCGVTLRNGSAVLRGDCLSYNEFQAHLIIDGRVLEQAKVDLVLQPPGSFPLEATGRVTSAPPQPVRGGRYELLIELLRPPVEVSEDEPTRVSSAPQPPTGRASTFDPPNLSQEGASNGRDDYVVEDAVRKLSSNLSSIAGTLPGGAALDLDGLDRIDDGPALSPVPGAGRTRTGAFIQNDPVDGIVAFVRYRRPETFVRAFEEQLQHRCVFLCVALDAEEGAPVRLRFRLPRQTVAYTARGVIDSTAERGEVPPGREGYWVRLETAPKVTTNAFETAYAVGAPDRAASRHTGGFLSWLGLRRSA